MLEVNSSYTPECRERIRIDLGIAEQESDEITDQLIAEAMMRDSGWRPTFVKLSCSAY